SAHGTSAASVFKARRLYGRSLAGILPRSGVLPVSETTAPGLLLRLFTHLVGGMPGATRHGRMHDHREESHMQRRIQIAPLILLLLLAAMMLPTTPTVFAEPERMYWTARIAGMDQALKRGDAPATQAAWREAYVAAHVSRGWPAMIAVGDAAMRASGLVGAQVSEVHARRASLTALLRARRQASLDGGLAAGGAFGRLGEKAGVQEAVDCATDRAEGSGDGAARRRVQSFQTQWAPRT